MGDTTRYWVPGLSIHFIFTAFFAALLSHRIYKWAYYHLPSEGETQNIHGPFEINLLKPSDFVEMSFDEWIEYIPAMQIKSGFMRLPNRLKLKPLTILSINCPRRDCGLDYGTRIRLARTSSFGP